VSRRRRYQLGALAVALAAASTVAVSIATAGQRSARIDRSKPPVHFASVAAKIPGVDLLTSMGSGAKAAAAWINAHGGFGGRKVVVDYCNSMFQPSTATVCAHSTLAKHPAAMLGCEVVWSQAGLQLYAKAHVPSFNCVNSTADKTNPWSFGLNGGGFGEQRGMANWLCTQSSVKTVAMLGPDLPTERVNESASYGGGLKRCGKPISYTWAPVTAADYTPYVLQVLSHKPDFVVVQVPGGAQAIQVAKVLQQNNFPASKVGYASSGFAYADALKPAGSLMDGAYSQLSWKSWGDAKDPEVAAYRSAMKSSTVDARSNLPGYGYVPLMWFYTVAKQVGFDKFNAQTLTQFTRTKSGVHIPMSRTLINPGPKGRPQVKQPYVQIVQWKNGKLVSKGWVKGY